MELNQLPVVQLKTALSHLEIKSLRRLIVPASRSDELLFEQTFFLEQSKIFYVHGKSPFRRGNYLLIPSLCIF